MKAERLFLLGLAFMLLLAGLVTLRGALAALALPLLAYLGVAVWGRTAGASLSAVRRLEPALVHPGQAVETEVEFENAGATALEFDLRLPLPAGVLQSEGQSEAHLLLAPGERVKLPGTLYGRRGEHTFVDVQLETMEPLGLFGRLQTLPAPARLTVEPAGDALRSFLLRPPQTRGFAGPVLARQGGRGTDFFIVREYQAGDPLRQVNWKVSSRATRALYTNVYEQQRIADVGIILDAREPVDLRITASESPTGLRSASPAGLRSASPTGLRSASLFEHAVRAAATLAPPILRAGNRLGLLIYGPGMESVFPGYGRKQLRRVLRALTQAGAGHNFALESLAHLPIQFFPAGSQIILISPLLPEDSPLVARLVSIGYGVLLISPNPLIFELGESADALSDDLAVRVARAERHLALQRLQRAGVRVIDWDVRQPLAPLVANALKR
jgi:uncharacterized protein (DUF58 family)